MADVTPQLQAAVAHHQAGRLADAAAGYDDILAEVPEHADARHLRALIAFQEGALDAALIGIDQAIGIDADIAMYHANRGRVLKAAGRNEDAAAAFAQALRLQPGEPGTLSDFAGALVDSGAAEHALHFVIRATELAPDFVPAHYNMGLAYLATGESRPARAAFERAIEIDPTFAPAHFEIGRLFHEEKNPGRAETHYRNALAQDPSMIEAHANLGNLLRARLDLEDAIVCYRHALDLDDGVAAVHGNLGVALQEIGDAEAALAAYDRALDLQPDDAETRRNRAQVLLQLGRYEEGWREFEWRWQTQHFAAIRRTWAMPQWQGERIKGDTVLVHAEQGFGDTLQFARYLPLLAARVAKVIVECPSPVAGLVAGVAGVDDVVAAGQPLPDFDAHIPMMSLPGAFRTAERDIPADVPYLSVPDAAINAWNGRFGEGGVVKVGIVWKGSQNHQRNQWRSPGLDAMRPLLAAEGARFVSLQKDDEALDLRTANLGTHVLPMGQEFRDFSDTAAAIGHLDLVIAPDTSVAHLAGALGKPVWLMLPHVAEWRWLMNRNDSPWYPTMRLYRQTARGDWRGAIDQMSLDLAAFSPPPRE